PLTASQKMGDQLLGRGFSGAAGDGHDRKWAAAKPVGSHVEQRLAGVVDQDDRGAVDALRRPLAEHASGTVLYRLGDEDVPIMLLAPERHEEAARFDLARVRKEVSERDIRGAAQQAATGRLDDLFH